MFLNQVIVNCLCFLYKYNNYIYETTIGNREKTCIVNYYIVDFSLT